MIFIDKYNRSVLNKLLFCGSILFTLIAALWLMFAEYASPNTWLAQYQMNGDLLRRILVAFCLVIYIVRLQVTVWVFQQRKWTWTETVTITILMSFVVYSYASAGGNNGRAVGALDVIGLLIYLLGSYINTHSEYDRHVWKLKEKNRGQIYTKGLFSFSMHINYFGDIVLFTGLAVVTNCFSMLLIPLIMAINFIFNIIPSLDSYLEKKYKDQFRNYAKNTKKFIPKIY